MARARDQSTGYVMPLWTAADVASAGIFPLAVALVAAAAVYASRTDLSASLGLLPHAGDGIVLLAVLLPAYALIAALEHVHPYDPVWNQPADDTPTDVLHIIVNGLGTGQIAAAAARAVTTGLAAALAAAGAAGGATLWPTRSPALFQLWLALLIAELGHYWFHRLGHAHPTVWRVHAVHHSAPRLYWLNATRFHPIDLFALIVFQLLPLLALGAGPRVILMYGIFTGVYGQLQHSNIDVRTGLWNWLFSTPEQHRWHHSVDAREAQHNYAAVLSTWDLVFGTFFLPRERDFDGRVGIGSMPGFPSRYVDQLRSPFRFHRLGVSAAIVDPHLPRTE